MLIELNYLGESVDCPVKGRGKCSGIVFSRLTVYAKRGRSEKDRPQRRNLQTKLQQIIEVLRRFRWTVQNYQKGGTQKEKEDAGESPAFLLLVERLLAERAMGRDLLS
jgi:hypothetical protein